MHKYIDFQEALIRVQEHISNKYAVLIDEEIESSKSQMKAYIKKYIEDHKLRVEGYSIEQLVQRIYIEMAEFSFLTQYLDRNDIEEINVNSYNDIKITYSNGEIIPSKEHFNSPTHAMDVIRRLLHQSGMILDSSQPIVVGHLSDKIRITAIAKGVVDKDIGVAVSIRIVNPRKLTKRDFIKGGTASKEMLDFLSLTHRYGESICFTGATSSGKTTLMSYILSTLPNDKRIFTIENGTREFNLVKKNEKGDVINNVIHTVTRHSDDPKQSITMAKLLETALTVNPDYICVAEMKSDEAFYAQESARSGHGVSTTIHANSCIATYYRMVTLCKQRYDMDEKTLYNLVTEAFPIIAFCKKLEDNTRHIMEITECQIQPDGTREIHTLYRYNITDNVEVEGKQRIIGYYEKVNDISATMQKRLLENGMSKSELKTFLGGRKSE
ncbi:ATPase, T2SS/T4P/T4SS family [Maledivibacter halophilus]|uniref:Pilus assembly protein CpaF n=1 Tax=Maledivibacter halophilus TaxID=36842 RepID=A0A1T5LP70_9FIRM|nr:ATPase, T2SS/T4P/T4SS family [Maledivibacter halophilus]SKC77675.1 pilus assembly protein CpaF [Maledivibacter halophilus]